MGPHASELLKDFIAFEFVECIFKSWHIRALEVSEGTFCYCKFFFGFFFFFFLLEFMFDTRACHLIFLSVEMFI